MAYELDQFITDCHSILSRDPGPSGREEVRTKLEHLLHNKDFVKKHCEDAPRGTIFGFGPAGIQRTSLPRRVLERAPVFPVKRRGHLTRASDAAGDSVM